MLAFVLLSVASGCLVSEVRITGLCNAENLKAQYPGAVALSDAAIDAACRKVGHGNEEKLESLLEKDLEWLGDFFDGATTWNVETEDDDGNYNLESSSEVARAAFERAVASRKVQWPKIRQFIAAEDCTSEKCTGTDCCAPQNTKETICHSDYEPLFTGENCDDDAKKYTCCKPQPKGPSCSYDAAMCCYTRDRQANDAHGACAEPYSETCQNARVTDNTDVCYTDTRRAPLSAAVDGGLVWLGSSDEGPVHCSGFYYGDDDLKRHYAANTLFHLAFQENLRDKGYVGNVPGAPMCACLEQMPTVTHADCTDLVIEQPQEWIFHFDCNNITTVTPGEQALLSWRPCQDTADLRAAMAAAAPSNILVDTCPVSISAIL